MRLHRPNMVEATPASTISLSSPPPIEAPIKRERCSWKDQALRMGSVLDAATDGPGFGQIFHAVNNNPQLRRG